MIIEALAEFLAAHRRYLTHPPAADRAAEGQSWVGCLGAGLACLVVSLRTR